MLIVYVVRNPWYYYWHCYRDIIVDIDIIVIKIDSATVSHINHFHFCLLRWQHSSTHHLFLCCIFCVYRCLLCRCRWWRKEEKGNLSKTKIAFIPRSREVGQSYFSSIFTTIQAIFGALFAVFKHKPELVSQDHTEHILPFRWIIASSLYHHCITTFLFLLTTPLCKDALQWTRNMSPCGSGGLDYEDIFISQMPHHLSGKLLSRWITITMWQTDLSFRRSIHRSMAAPSIRMEANRVSRKTVLRLSSSSSQGPIINSFQKRPSSTSSPIFMSLSIRMVAREWLWLWVGVTSTSERNWWSQPPRCWIMAVSLLSTLSAVIYCRSMIDRFDNVIGAQIIRC